MLEYESVYTQLNNTKTKIQKKYSKKEEQIHNKVKELKNITVENDIEALEQKKIRREREIVFNNQKLDKYKKYKKDNKVKMSDINSKMSKINIDELKIKKSVLDLEKENNSRLVKDIEVKKVSVRKK